MIKENELLNFNYKTYTSDIVTIEAKQNQLDFD